MVLFVCMLNVPVNSYVHVKIFTFSKQAFNVSLEFATVHSLINHTKFDRQLPSSLARAIRFKYLINSPDVTLVL